MFNLRLLSLYGVNGREVSINLTVCASDRCSICDNFYIAIEIFFCIYFSYWFDYCYEDAWLSFGKKGKKTFNFYYILVLGWFNLNI